MTSTASPSPTSRTGKASFSAGAWAFSQGSGSAVLSAGRAARRVVPAREGAGPGPVPPVLRAHFGLGDTFREALSLSPMEIDVATI